MAVARITEITASGKGIEEALEAGLKRAGRTLRGITGVEITSIKCKVADGKIKEYRVTARVMFVLEE